MSTATAKNIATYIFDAIIIGAGGENIAPPFFTKKSRCLSFQTGKAKHNHILKRITMKFEKNAEILLIN